jgi:hypothetical protein
MDGRRMMMDRPLGDQSWQGGRRRANDGSDKALQRAIRYDRIHSRQNFFSVIIRIIMISSCSRRSIVAARTWRSPPVSSNRRPRDLGRTAPAAP